MEKKVRSLLIGLLHIGLCIGSIACHEWIIVEEEGELVRDRYFEVQIFTDEDKSFVPGLYQRRGPSLCLCFQLDFHLRNMITLSSFMYLSPALLLSFLPK